MPLLIRPATGEDEAAAVALWHVCRLVAPYNDPGADFRRACGGPASDVLLGFEDGRLRGSVMVGHDGHRGWLYYVASAPEARGQGTGRAMVRAAEAWLRARQVPKVMLLVRETNAAVAAFYGNLGFEAAPSRVLQRWLDR